MANARTPIAEIESPPHVDDVPVPVWSSTADGQVTSANPAARGLGLLAGRSWLEDAEEPAVLRKALATQTSLVVDARLRPAAEGEGRHRIVGSRSGSRWTLTATDVRDLVPAAGPGEAEEARLALAVLEERLVRALEAARALVYEVSVDDDAVVGVVGLQGLLGPVPAPDGSRGWWPSLVHPEDRSVLENRRLNGASEGTVEYRVRHHDGRWLTVRDYDRIHTEGGRRRIFGTVVDVTAERAYRAALEQAHRQKDEFIALLGHELRNPLSAIRYAVTLQQRVPTTDERIQRTREIIDRQSRHMAGLVDSLLDVARVGRARLSLDRTQIDLASLVRQAVSDHEARARSMEITLSTSTPPGSVPVMGDAARLLQVIDNLVGNAIKFSEAGGRVDVVLESGADAVITVTDTGVGIEAHLLARLFEPFRRLVGHPVHPRAGLGLGLALAKGIVELHGGRLTARSEGLGHGATFQITLPGPDHEPIGG